MVVGFLQDLLGDSVRQALIGGRSILLLKEGGRSQNNQKRRTPKATYTIQFLLFFKSPLPLLTPLQNPWDQLCPSSGWSLSENSTKRQEHLLLLRLKASSCRGMRQPYLIKLILFSCIHQIVDDSEKQRFFQLFLDQGFGFCLDSWCWCFLLVELSVSGQLIVVGGCRTNWRVCFL